MWRSRFRAGRARRLRRRYSSERQRRPHRLPRCGIAVARRSRLATLEADHHRNERRHCGTDRERPDEGRRRPATMRPGCRRRRRRLAVTRWCMRRFLSSPSWTAARRHRRAAARCAARRSRRRVKLDAAIVDRLRATTKQTASVRGLRVSPSSAAAPGPHRGAERPSRPCVWTSSPATTASRRRRRSCAWASFELRPPVDDAGLTGVTVQLGKRSRSPLPALATMRAARSSAACAPTTTPSSPSPRTAAAPTAAMHRKRRRRRAGEPLLARSCTDADRHGVTVPFDILVGADGPRSRVRDALDLTCAVLASPLPTAACGALRRR